MSKPHEIDPKDKLLKEKIESFSSEMKSTKKTIDELKKKYSLRRRR